MLLLGVVADGRVAPRRGVGVAQAVQNLTLLREVLLLHCVLQIVQVALDGPEHVFLSIDIDVLDPSYAPGTGGLEPGGFTTMELLRAVRHIVSRIDIVGMDVSEVLPAWDTPGNITAVAANRVVMEAISAIAKKKAGAGNG